METEIYSSPPIEINHDDSVEANETIETLTSEQCAKFGGAALICAGCPMLKLCELKIVAMPEIVEPPTIELVSDQGSIFEIADVEPSETPTPDSVDAADSSVDQTVVAVHEKVEMVPKPKPSYLERLLDDDIAIVLADSLNAPGPELPISKEPGIIPTEIQPIVLETLEGTTSSTSENVQIPDDEIYQEKDDHDDADTPTGNGAVSLSIAAEQEGGSLATLSVQENKPAAKPHTSLSKSPLHDASKPVTVSQPTVETVIVADIIEQSVSEEPFRIDANEEADESIQFETDDTSKTIENSIQEECSELDVIIVEKCENYDDNSSPERPKDEVEWYVQSIIASTIKEAANQNLEEALIDGHDSIDPELRLVGVTLSSGAVTTIKHLATLALKWLMINQPKPQSTT